MNVSFLTTTAANLNNVEVLDGQIIALTDTNGYYYDMGSKRHPATGLRTVSELPEVGEDNTIYAIFSTRYNKVECYMYDIDTSAYMPIWGSVDFESMTWAQYNALTDEEKNDGTVRFITDKNASALSQVINDSQESTVTTYSSTKMTTMIAKLIESNMAKYLEDITSIKNRLNAVEAVADISLIVESNSGQDSADSSNDTASESDSN